MVSPSAAVQNLYSDFWGAIYLDFILFRLVYRLGYMRAELQIEAYKRYKRQTSCALFLRQRSELLVTA